MSVLRKGILPAAIGLALGSAAAGPAGAATGWYVGLGAGSTSIDNLDSANGSELEAALGDLGITATIDSFSADDSDTGLKLFGGYQLNDYFAIEGFYADLGSFDVIFSGTVEGGEGAVELSGKVGADVTGYGVFGVLMYPVGAGFSVFGKIGGIHWDADIPATVLVDTETSSETMGDEGNEFAWGGGVKYQVTEHIAVDVQYEQFTTIEDIDLISGNVRWGF